jgi:SAM-dependent methyltransferase
VFDVSDDYRVFWREWISIDATATYKLPDDWRGSFDLITAHFMLEHVVDPHSILIDLASLLSPEGQLFLLVPNAIANPSDLIVVDHLSHFTAGSLRNLLSRAGLDVKVIDDARFPGALIVLCTPGMITKNDIFPEEARHLKQEAAQWVRLSEHLRAAAKTHLGKRCAIYGAGVYGTYIRNLLSESADLVCFLDRNPHIQGTIHMGLPVFIPEDVPGDVSIIYAGLNPKKARSIIASVPKLIERECIWLD